MWVVRSVSTLIMLLFIYIVKNSLDFFFKKTVCCFFLYEILSCPFYFNGYFSLQTFSALFKSFYFILYLPFKRDYFVYLGREKNMSERRTRLISAYIDGRRIPIFGKPDDLISEPKKLASFIFLLKIQQ